MKRSFWINACVIVALLVGALIYFLNTLQPVARVSAVKRDVAIRSVPGTVEVLARETMAIRGDRSGRVIESNLDEGAFVAEGDVLLRLDTTDLEIEIERVQLEIESAELIVERGSSRQFDLPTVQGRLEALARRVEAGTASKFELEAAQRDLSKLEQSIEAERTLKELSLAQLKNALRKLERDRVKMTIKAPMGGIVTNVNVLRGDLIGAGQELASLISLERVVRARVSEENFSGIELGQVAHVRFLGYGDSIYPAKVSKTLPVADPETQRYTIHLDVALEDEKLFPGLTGEATITLDEREQTLVVPGAAIVGDRVFVVSGGVVSMKTIQKGYGSMTSVEVLSGLEESDLVIVDGLDRYRVGDRVRVERVSF